MAVLPSKGGGGAAGHSGTGARFRQRKISVKQPLTIYKQKDLPALDATNELEPSQVHHLNQGSGAQQRDIHSIETGVDKNEEDEVHLQQVINAAQKALLGSKSSGGQDKKKEAESQVYIPTPDASRIWAEAHKYYTDHSFTEPDSYIKFSATVEDTVGVEYNMDERDEEFLEKLNKGVVGVDGKHGRFSRNDKVGKSDDEARKCTELEFELVCDKFEKTIEKKQPFLSMDPSNILSYKELTSHILSELKNSSHHDLVSLSDTSYLSTTALKERLSHELCYEPFVTLFDKNPTDEKARKNIRLLPMLLELFGEAIYNHWKERKIERNGKQISPSLKFEDPGANEKDNDNDPYICFRRREVRQARKTRRADTLGAERLRLLQKSIHRARNLILSVCQRELTKLQVYETDQLIFRSRCEAKNLKRSVGIKGDDHLFYPHKRKRVIKPPKEEEEEKQMARIRRERRSKLENSREGSAAIQNDKYYNGQANQDNNTGSQPYVKLPPSKIPDMDLVTVSLVLKEKNETIKRAVLEKLRKRKEQDKGFFNTTDDPYQPFFNITTNSNMKYSELNHIPYSSIAATSFYEILTSNYIGERLRNLLEEGKKPIAGTKTFRGSNGELIPSKPFPHLLSLLEDHISGNKSNSSGYVSQLLSNIENNNFSAYNNGYGQFNQDQGGNNDNKLSDPVFRVRKRVARGDRVFIDRRSLHQRPTREIENYIKFGGGDEPDLEKSPDKSLNQSNLVPNAYDCREDQIKRLDSRWKFDNDLSEYEKGHHNPFSLDPSRLNSISDDTQSIRFGSMLLSKSYDLLRESIHQRHQSFIQQARMRSLQQQQYANKQQSSNASSRNSTSSNLPLSSTESGLNADATRSYNQSQPLNPQNPNGGVGQNSPASYSKPSIKGSSGAGMSPKLPTQAQNKGNNTSNSPLLASQVQGYNVKQQKLNKTANAQ